MSTGCARGAMRTSFCAFLMTGLKKTMSLGKGTRITSAMQVSGLTQPYQTKAAAPQCSVLKRFAGWALNFGSMRTLQKLEGTRSASTMNVKMTYETSVSVRITTGLHTRQMDLV